MADKSARTITVRKVKDERSRIKVKSRSGSVGDAFSGVDWWHPSLTPEHLKKKPSDVHIVELEVEADNQRDAGEKPKHKCEPVMAIHPTIDVQKYLKEGEKG